MNSALSKEMFDDQTKHFSERLLELREWTVNKMSYPILDVTFSRPGRKQFRVRMICDNYDEFPSSIELLGGDGAYLVHAPTGSNVINIGKHQNTQRPFICSPGSLEYHTHPSHLTDLWENYKGTSRYDLGGMLTQIHNAWLKTQDVA
ncbi:MAG: hypothetical protein U5K54_25920 [Cytophagales bacterium]|nr:hypothetical protein [Cytophagales bacterium]